MARCRKGDALLVEASAAPHSRLFASFAFKLGTGASRNERPAHLTSLVSARWLAVLLPRSHPTIMLHTNETALGRVVCPRRMDPFATELQLPERLPRGRWALPTPKDRPLTPETPLDTVLKVSS